MKNLLILTLLLTIGWASNASGQLKETGRLNAWTARKISRANENRKATPYLKEIRVARNKGFERIVFKFAGDIPPYQIEYVAPPIVNTAEEEIKVMGKYFVSVILHTLPYPEDKELENVGMVTDFKEKVVSEIREIEWFEGDRWYVVGLTAKKLFRVQQLKNPTRLVIDFKQ